MLKFFIFSFLSILRTDETRPSNIDIMQINDFILKNFTALYIGEVAVNNGYKTREVNGKYEYASFRGLQ
jgi:hypothetical protein